MRYVYNGRRYDALLRSDSPLDIFNIILISFKSDQKPFMFNIT